MLSNAFQLNSISMAHNTGYSGEPGTCDPWLRFLIQQLFIDHLLSDKLCFLLGNTAVKKTKSLPHEAYTQSHGVYNLSDDFNVRFRKSFLSHCKHLVTGWWDAKENNSPSACNVPESSPKFRQYMSPRLITKSLSLGSENMQQVTQITWSKIK